MKTVIKLLAIVFLSFLQPFEAGGKDVLIMFWNLENMFDTCASNGGEEFSASGQRRWTSKRFKAKIEAVSKTVFWIARQYGHLPEIIGFAEIENKSVLERLVNDTALRRCGYRIIHFDSPDSRGIDVALLYREEALRPLNSMSVYAGVPDTRDILCVDFDTGFRITVNHHPSKYGGEEETMVAREKVMKSLLALAGGERFIAMGDFNDTPDSKSLEMADSLLCNKAVCLAERGEGTIRFNGRWEVIDMFLVSSDLSGKTEMTIPRPPFLMTRDSRFSGEKPLRTYSGPKYMGGVSDHLPIILTVE